MNKWFAGCGNVKLFELHNKSSGIKFVVSEGKRMSDTPDIAEKFNSFFIRMTSTLANKIKLPDAIHCRRFLHQNVLWSFKFDLLGDKITHVTRCLHNKLSGKDDISLKVIEYLIPGLSKPLIQVTNQSLLTAIFPDRLKIAKVITLYQKYLEKKMIHEQLTILLDIT